MSFIKADLNDPYFFLLSTFRDAFIRASQGKGLRHVIHGREPFNQQQICRGARIFGIGYPLGQVSKKVEEIPRMSRLRDQYNEILDVIVYAAAAAIVTKELIDADEATVREKKEADAVPTQIGNTASVPLRVEEIKEVQPASDCPAETGRRAVPRYPTEG